MDYSSRGQLVPDEPTIELWRQFIDAARKIGRFHPAADTLVLDGIPRNTAQAEMLNDALDVIAVFYLTCSQPGKPRRRACNAARIKENRLDDANLDVIRTPPENLREGNQACAQFLRQKSSSIASTPTARRPRRFLDILKLVVKL